MEKTKVLIISMTGGFGHIRAGEALLDYAKEYMPHVDAKHIDIANASMWSKKLTGKIYNAMSRDLPLIWRVVYSLMDSSFTSDTAKKMVGFLSMFLSKKQKKYIFEQHADHFLFTNVVLLPLLGESIRKKYPKATIAVVVTDYHGHPYYQFSFVDYYFVPHEKVKEDLVKLGMDKGKVVVSGMPINPRFYIKQSVKELKKKYGLNDKREVVLCIASFRAKAEEVVGLIEKLLKRKPLLDIIVITSGNAALYRQLTQDFPKEEQIKLVTWTNAIEEYIKMSDVVISKAGGLTVSECLTLKKRMIIVNPIPGQEEHNAMFLEANGFGRRADTIHEVPRLLEEMLSGKKRVPDGILPAENPSKEILNRFVAHAQHHHSDLK